MASPGLALSGFTNLDQEFAPEYSNPLSGSAPSNSAAGTDFQPVPVKIAHDTVTLSNTRSQSDPYQAPGTIAAAAASAVASNQSVPPKASTPPISTTRNSDSSQTSTKGETESTIASVPKPPPKPEATARPSAATQDDSYQATTQTTQQSLLQLDRTLQQIGVDPQHTSLVRRVALVRLANDPPALGEYFGPPSSVAETVAETAASSPARTHAAAPEPSASKPAANTPKTSPDAPHRSFVPPGKLLNVSA